MHVHQQIIRYCRILVGAVEHTLATPDLSCFISSVDRLIELIMCLAPR